MVCGVSKKRLVFAFLTTLFSALISISVYRLWGTDLRVPISGYRSDSLGVLLELKNYVRGGSVHHFVIYGEPYADVYAASFGDSSCPMPLLKLIWRLTGSVEEAVNIHAVLNSVLLSLALFWVCTRLGVECFFHGGWCGLWKSFVFHIGSQHGAHDLWCLFLHSFVLLYTDRTDASGWHAA